MSKFKPAQEPAPEDAKTAGAPKDRRLVALQVFGAEISEAFAEASARQTESLRVTSDRLSDLVQRSMTLRDPRAAAGLQAEITACLADASQANVAIWDALVRRIQDGCGRYGAAASGVCGQDGPDAPDLIVAPRTRN